MFQEKPETIATKVTIIYQNTNESTTSKIETKTTLNNIIPSTPVPTQQILIQQNNTNNTIQPSLFSKVLRVIYIPISAFFHAPKVTHVLRNIGTCLVNGMMEIVSYYLPAPLIPLITTTASQMIPFEPLTMLREKMPVASYRRAFLTAIRSFLGTFDKYKLEENFDDDPYMMDQFNRRMMRYSSGESSNKSKKKRID